MVRPAHHERNFFPAHPEPVEGRAFAVQSPSPTSEECLKSQKNRLDLGEEARAPAFSSETRCTGRNRYGFQPLALISSLAFFTKARSKMSLTLMSRWTLVVFFIASIIDCKTLSSV